MKKKVIEYTILLLLIPILFIVILGAKEHNKNIDYDRSVYDVKTNDQVDTLYVPQHDKNTYEYEVKTTDTYIYLSIGGLFAIAGLTYIFFIKKRD